MTQIYSDAYEIMVKLLFLIMLRPNPKGFVYMSWKERDGGDMEGRKQ